MEIKKVSNGIVSGYVVTTEEEQQASPVPEHWQRALDSLRGLVPPTRGIGSAVSSFEDHSKSQTSLDKLFESNSGSREQKVSASTGKDGIKWGNSGGSGV
jgi:hypothetical protein